MTLALLGVRIIDYFQGHNPPLYKDVIFITFFILTGLYAAIKLTPHLIKKLIPVIFCLFGCLNALYGIILSK